GRRPSRRIHPRSDPGAAGPVERGRGSERSRLLGGRQPDRVHRRRGLPRSDAGNRADLDPDRGCAGADRRRVSALRVGPDRAQGPGRPPADPRTGPGGRAAGFALRL
ncbi:MAG: hypothetical protein AVDCRST_MAG73-2861, partial [uncultured Thermomicrobiales bacterium]